MEIRDELLFHKLASGQIFLAPKPIAEPTATLPAGYYSLSYDEKLGYTLQAELPFEAPPKLFGKSEEHSARIMATYRSRQGVNTGVMLAGLKGQGKSLLAKTVCRRAVEELNNIVIIVSQNFSGVEYIRFLQSIRQPAVIFVDEFEKVYPDSKNVSALLSILDGIVSGTKLFLFTANATEGNHVSPLRSRPGRMYYWINFNKLDESVVREYCEANLNNPAHLQTLISFCSTGVMDVSFDVMKALVEEVNRFDKCSTELFEIVNVSADTSRNSNWLSHFKGPKGEAIKIDQDTIEPRRVLCYWSTDDDMEHRQRALFLLPEDICGPVQEGEYEVVQLKNKEGYSVRWCRYPSGYPL